MALTIPAYPEQDTIPATMRAAVLFDPGPMGLMTAQACKQMGAAQGRLRGAELVTHGFPLEDIAEAFRVLHERIDDPIKIVLIP